MHISPFRTAAIGVAAVLAVALSGCSSDDTAPAPSASTSGSGGNAAADEVTKAVTDAYVGFFDGKTPGDKKITLVEKGPQFANTIHAQADSPMATGTTAKVVTVKQESPTRASVTYTISINGTPALQNQQGTAVKSGDTWKVSAQSFCALLKLEGNPPPVCGAPAAAPPTT